MNIRIDRFGGIIGMTRVKFKMLVKLRTYGRDDTFGCDKNGFAWIMLESHKSHKSFASSHFSGKNATIMSNNPVESIGLVIIGYSISNKKGCCS